MSEEIASYMVKSYDDAQGNLIGCTMWKAESCQYMDVREQVVQLGCSREVTAVVD